jgi:hypothetical protein
MTKFLKIRNLLLVSLLLISGAATTFFISSCQKEKLPAATAESTTTPLLPSCPGFCSNCGDDPCAPKTVLEAVTTLADPANNQENMIYYHYAQAIRDAVKTPAFLQYIMNEMTVNNQGVSVSIYRLAQNNPAFATYINTKLRQSILANYIYPRGVEPGIEALIVNPNWDANLYLKSHLQNAGFYFDPVVFYKTKPVPTAVTLPVTVLIGQEVNDCDDAAGWKGDVESLVGEVEGRSGDRVVMIVGPGTDGNVNTGISVASAAEAEDRTSRVSMKSIKIKGSAYRYENSGKSEITGAYIGYTYSPVVKKTNFLY